MLPFNPDAIASQSQEKKVRYTLTIPKRDYLILQQQIPWGLSTHLFTLICHDLAEKLSDPTFRRCILEKVVSQTLTLDDIVAMKKEQGGTNDEPR